MLNTLIDNIKLERAKFSRDVEYLRELAIEDNLDDIMEGVEEEMLGSMDTSAELLEAAEDLEKLSDEDEEFSNNEITKIMEATEDMTFDELIDVDSYIEKV